MFLVNKKLEFESIVSPGEQKCDEEELRKWREAVYMGYHGGPAMSEVEDYLSTGGVEVDSSAKPPQRSI